MRIIEEEQLDFDDVLIMPRRSSLNSRNEVNIFREFKFAKKPVEEGGGCRTLTGIPVMGSNMGPIATPKMAKLFASKTFFERPTTKRAKPSKKSSSVSLRFLI